MARKATSWDQVAKSGSTTPNFGFSLPAIGGNQDSWGNLLNANWTAADTVIHTLASGYLPLAGGGTVTGNLAVTGDVGVGGNLGVTKSLTVTGTMSATSGSVTVTKDLGVGGNLGVTGTATITGATAITGSVTIGGTVGITGNLSADNIQAAETVAMRAARTFIGAVGGNVQFQYDPNFYWLWESAGGAPGSLGWHTPLGMLWYMRESDGKVLNTVNNVGGIGAYENNSDARGKEAVADSNLGLDAILRLRPVALSAHR